MFQAGPARHLIVGAALALALIGCTVNATFNVMPEQLPGATVGQVYEVAITAIYPEGGNVPTLSLTADSGALPPGITFRHTYQGGAAILGTPTTAGTYTFKLRATGEGCAMNGCPFGVRDYTLVVSQ